MKNLVKHYITLGVLFFASGPTCFAQESKASKLFRMGIFGASGSKLSGAGVEMMYTMLPMGNPNQLRVEVKMGPQAENPNESMAVGRVGFGVLRDVSPGLLFGGEMFGDFTRYSASVGPALALKTLDWSESGKTIEFYYSPLVTSEFGRGGSPVRGDLTAGTRLGIRVSQPLTKSLRALISGSVLKSYSAVDVDAVGELSLECDVGKNISLNLGFCAEGGVVENIDPVTKVKSIQNFSTGTLLTAGIAYRIAE